VPVRSELIATLADLEARKRGAILRLAQRRRADLRSLARALPSAEALVEALRQRLDRAGDTLAARARAAFDSRALRLAGLARSLARHSPRAHFAGLRERVRGLVGRLERIAPMLIERPRRGADAAGRALARERAVLARRRSERSQTLLGLEARLNRTFDERLQSRRSQLASAWQLLGAMSYRGVLARGFALVRDEADRPLRRAAEVRQAQRLQIEFADGKVAAVAGGRVGPPLTPPALLPRRRAKADKGSEGQGSLF
jgi:exodeoxyribonuclease VII large subunit